MTAPEERIAIVQRAIDAWNDQDVEGFVTCYSEQLIVRTSDGERAVTVSREEHREAARSWWKRFPDLVETTQESLAQGEWVFVRTSSTGTHQARFRGIEPTGKRVTWEAWYVYRIQDGLITEERMLMDMLGLLEQLGGVERPGV